MKRKWHRSTLTGLTLLSASLSANFSGNNCATDPALLMFVLLFGEVRLLVLFVADFVLQIKRSGQIWSEFNYLAR